MRKQLVAVSLGIVVLVGNACYHATVNTGRAPSGQVVEKDWAHSFLWGLVPPSTVETAAQCPNGVARVETQLSFLNMLANWLTGGIYSPMSVTVQCAAAGTALNAEHLITVPAGAGIKELGAALNNAAEKASEEHKPVYVKFSDLK